VADHDDHILLTACRASAFLPPKIGTQSDHGWSDAVSCNYEGAPRVRCILDNLKLKAISTLHSNSKRRKGNASVTRDLDAPPLDAFGPSSVGICTCSATFVTSLLGGMHFQKPVLSHVGRFDKNDGHYL
jgi:hypothetical protein